MQCGHLVWFRVRANGLSRLISLTLVDPKSLNYSPQNKDAMSFAYFGFYSKSMDNGINRYEREQFLSATEFESLAVLDSNGLGILT